MKIFVYGTLLPGLRLHALLAESFMIDHGFVEDVALYDLGDYPALVEGEGCVVGEVYEIAESTLARLDQVEGFERLRPQHSLYIRCTVTVWGFSGEVFEAETYVYNDRVGKVAMPIVSGDYRRYLMERESQKPVWVVAYGSNLSRNRLEQRVGPVARGQAFRLADYVLCFNKEGARANLIREPGSSAPVVAWLLDRKQLGCLDVFEGTPEHYLRLGITAKVEGKPVLMQVYLAHPDRLEPEECPEPEYLAHVLAGYREQGFDEEDVLQRWRR